MNEDENREGESENSVSRIAEPSIVVVNSRGRNLSAKLLPPMMIVLLALAILSYQKQTPIRSLRSVQTNAASPSLKAAQEPSKGVTAKSRVEAPIIARMESRDVKVPAPLPVPPPDPVLPTSLATPVNYRMAIHPEVGKDRDHLHDSSIKRAVALAPPSAEDSSQAEGSSKPPSESKAPEPPPLLSPVVPQPSLPSGQADKAPTPNTKGKDEGPAVANPSRAVTKEEIEADIQREAAQKKAELQEFEQLKPARRSDQIEESRRAAQRARAPFHDDLRRLLKLAGNSAGPQIEALCDQYGRTVQPEIHEAVNATLMRTHGRLSRQSKVDMMRRMGLPEPKILEFIANEVHMTMNMPSGPRDPDEVWVRSARLLLAMPINTPKKASTKARTASGTMKPTAPQAAPSSPSVKGRAK